MLLVVGALVVVGAVIGGYLAAGGALLVLFQPAEFIVIIGAAIGNLLISTPIDVLKRMAAQIGALLRHAAAKSDYAELLGLLFQIFKQMQQDGVMSLEAHFEEPEKSPVLSQYPRFLARRDALDFLADSAKVMVVGGITPHDLDALMTEDLASRRHEALEPSMSLARVADALPGLGIVAAVLGVVITMAHIDGPPSEIGHKIAAALIGTFFGILLSYGFVQPLASSLEHRVTEDQHYLQCIKAGLLAAYKGSAPAVSVECARRVLPEHVRPSFAETEQMCRAFRKTDASTTKAA